MPTRTKDEKKIYLPRAGPPKTLYGLFTPIPEPLYDWEAIRPLKIRCRAQCPSYDHWITTCGLGLTPGIDCPGQNPT